MSLKNTAWYLRSRPTGEVSHDNFEIRFGEKPVPGPGQVLIRNLYLMVPASMRLWMNEKPTYFPPQPIGQVMMGGTLAVVEASNAPGFTPGMYVNTFAGWQTYAAMPPEQLIPVKPHPKIELAAYRSVLDVQGLTAYRGPRRSLRSEARRDARRHRGGRQRRLAGVPGRQEPRRDGHRRRGRRAEVRSG